MSKCIDCFHLHTQPAIYKDRVWCRKGIIKGLLSVDHPFFNVERSCEEFDDEELGGYYKSNGIFI